MLCSSFFCDIFVLILIVIKNTGAQEELGPGRAASWAPGRRGQARGKSEGAQNGAGGQVHANS